jgi:hypothetical protein
MDPVKTVVDSYGDLTQGGDVKASLTQEEACIVLKVHDDGIDVLTEDEKVLLYSVIAKLKENIWP